MSRMPAPAGPEKMRLGGSASRATDLASSAASLRWPHRLTTSPNGMGPSLSFLSAGYASDVRSVRLLGGRVPLARAGPVEAGHHVRLVRQVVQQLQDV